jgi:L-alanine-DL-glutamate epimerase-like enolase superfamily enzyme
MSESEPVVTAVTTGTVRTRYPRTVGRNARLGSHGSGGDTPVVVLETDTGHRGWGMVEGPPADVSALVGRPVAELIDPAVGVLDPSLYWLDIALHDLAGVLLDLPVHRMLGAAGSPTTPVYDGAIYFDDLDPDEQPRGLEIVLANCAADAAAGYGAFKLKIGRGNRWMDRASGDQRDIDVTRAVRKAWPEARILVDANDGYDCTGFLNYVDAVADCELYWIEEPFLDDAADLARLRAHLDAVSPDTLIADGETSPDVEQVLTIAAHGHVDVLLMDVLSFGVTRWRQLMPQAREIGVRASPHAWGRPLKTRYAAQLAAGLGNVPIIEGVPGHTAGVDTGSYRFTGGAVTVPDLPGFGLPVPVLD